MSHSPGSIVDQSGDVDAADLDKLREVLSLYRQELDAGGMSPDDAAEARRQLDVVEGQLRRRPLNRPLVRELLQSLRALAEGVAGNAVFAQLVSSLNLF